MIQIIGNMKDNIIILILLATASILGVYITNNNSNAIILKVHSMNLL